MILWSINIMIGILLVGVSISIYWIFKYDDWYPNNIDVDHSHFDRERVATESERVAVGAGSHSN